MSKLKLKQAKALQRGCHVIRHYQSKKWDVYVEAESLFGPRDLELTKRQAVNLAYAICISRKMKIIITYVNKFGEEIGFTEE